MATRKPGRDGRIRITDHSLEHAGVNKGDVVIINLAESPSQDKLCAAFTAWGELVVRYYRRKENGDIRLSTNAPGEIHQVFAPAALIVLGSVSSVIRAL